MFKQNHEDFLEVQQIETTTDFTLNDIFKKAKNKNKKDGKMPWCS